jgi:hypothetical protein
VKSWLKNVQILCIHSINNTSMVTGGILIRLVALTAAASRRSARRPRLAVQHRPWTQHTVEKVDPLDPCKEFRRDRRLPCNTLRNEDTAHPA